MLGHFSNCPVGTGEFSPAIHRWGSMTAMNLVP